MSLLDTRIPFSKGEHSVVTWVRTSNNADGKSSLDLGASVTI